MDVQAGLVIALYTALIIFVGFAIWCVRELVATARSVRTLSDDLQKTLPPLIERAESTLDSVDLELKRINGVVSQIEEVSDRVTSTTRAAQGLVDAPVAAMTGLAEGALTFLRTLFRK